MEILSHFRTIEELTKTLSREQGLLSEMFEKRKLMKFPLGVALELVGGNEMRLRRLIDYGVLVETGNTIEIESGLPQLFRGGAERQRGNQRAERPGVYQYAERVYRLLPARDQHQPKSRLPGQRAATAEKDWIQNPEECRGLEAQYGQCLQARAQLRHQEKEAAEYGREGP